MEPSISNLYYKILKIIQECGVNSFSHIAKKLDLSEELVKIIVRLNKVIVLLKQAFFFFLINLRRIYYNIFRNK